MPRREGLRPIGDSVKKIIEKIRKEREERQNRNKPVRTQPKLPGMKKGGAIEPEYTVKQEVKDRLKKENPKTSFLMFGLSPVTQYRKYKHRQNIKKERARDEAKVKKADGMKDGGKVKKREGGRGRKPRPRLGVPGLPERPRPTPRTGPPGRKPPRKKQDNSDRPKGFELKYPDRPSSPKNPVVVYSVKTGALIGGQKKLDANKDGKISGDDFKILKAKNNKMKGGGIAIRGTNFKGIY